MTGLNLHLFRHEGLSYIASIDIFLTHIYIRWFDILRSSCPLVALPSVYILYHRATFCLPFVLPCEELPQCLVSVELLFVRKRVVLPFVDVPPVGRMSSRARLSGFPYRRRLNGKLDKKWACRS